MIHTFFPYNRVTTRLSEGHISLCTTVRGLDILRNVFVGDMLHSTKSNVVIIISILTK